VAHFLIQALDRAPITLYGDGRQVRDVLFVEDLVDALLTAQERIDKLTGRAFNIGGGPENTTSLLELLALIGDLTGRQPDVKFAEWRTADQQYYVSDVRAFSELTGWSPRVGVRVGVAKLNHWLQEFRGALPEIELPSLPRSPRNPFNFRDDDGKRFRNGKKNNGKGLLPRLKPTP
jgi:CDP-paratose 2-epimerase